MTSNRPDIPPDREIVALLHRAADFLIANAVCPEDRIAHNGRRAYIWPVLRWLADNTKEAGYWRDAALACGREIMPEARQNPDGAWIIYPGLEGASNFSTNAIDCGIFVDSAHDLFELAPDETAEWRDRVRNVALTYNAGKIAGDRFIPNQILWCATGLARWVAANPADERTAELRSLLRETVEDILALVGPDGGAPYMTAEGQPWLAGPTTYYHGRCIAFSFYILDLIDADSAGLTSTLHTAAGFLLRMMQPDGRKQLAIETKRYYFSGETEVGSHPHDIYVYHRMYQATGEAVWRQAAGMCLRRLIDAQDGSGAIHSCPDAGTADWQCHTMRTTHLAWLTRVPVEFLNATLAEAPPRLAASHEFFEPGGKPSLVVAGNASGWTHVIVRKSPLIGWAGQRMSGLVATRTGNINNLSDRMGLSYRGKGRPLKFLRVHARDIFRSLKHALYHSRHLAFHPRSKRLAWRFFRDGFLIYTWVALFSRRSEFVPDLAGFLSSDNRISYRLDVANVRGGDREPIGQRQVSWSDDVMTVTDTISGTGRYRVRVPAPWTCDAGADGRGFVTLRAPCTVIYAVRLRDL